MSDSKSALDEAIGKLKQDRDELKLQIHLAGMEARDEYDRLTSKYDELTDQMQPLTSAMEETADNVWAALGLLADELKIGFQRVRKAITEESHKKSPGSDSK